MIASNSGPRWRTRMSTSPAVSGRRRSPTGVPLAIQAAHGARRSCSASSPAGSIPTAASNGASQPSISGLRLRLDQRPDLDDAGHRRRQRQVLRHAGCVGGDAAMDVGGGRTPRRPRRARSARSGTNGRTARAANAISASPNSPAKWRRISSILARRRALEREDRLLLVADREQRAGQEAARAGAGGEFRDQLLARSRHCFSLVSCASSISTWSRPRSSL